MRDHPRTKKEALALCAALYRRPPEAGARCGSTGGMPHFCGGEYLYTETDQCVTCSSERLWHEARDNPDKFPVTIDGALALGLDYTVNGKPCLHGPHLFAYPLRGGKCALCAQAKANSPRQVAKRAGEQKYLPKDPCPKCGQLALKRIDTGRCDGCYPPKQLTPRQVASRTGEQKYLPTDPCQYCGQLALRRVDNAQCDGCRQVAKTNASTARRAAPKSSRQIAKAAGEQKYLPIEPCPHCGQTALKRVDTGRCDGCNPHKRPPTISPNTRAVMGGTPANYLVDKITASAMDLTAYRDGKYCPEGHQNWKYISNSKCVTCGGDA